VGTGGFASVGSGGSSTAPQTCEEARRQRSYIGCEYWPTVTLNARLYSGFSFAVAIANPTAGPAQVSIERAGASIEQLSVPSGELATVTLPWVVELKQQETSGNGTELTSAVVRGGGYRLASSVPVVVYQFHPLEFELDPEPMSCPNTELVGGCFSFSNDASLLLPSAALRGEHYVLSYPTHHVGYENLVFMTTAWTSRPGFVAVTAIEDATGVTVTTPAEVRAGPEVTALAPGEQGSYQLNAGDVLMLASGVMPQEPSPKPDRPCVVETNGNYDVHKCPSPATFDLTGLHVMADRPVSVIGGHDCTFVPYDVFACDHLEESSFPLEALGRELVVSAPAAPSGGAPASTLLRVLSAADGNVVSFDPPLIAPVALDAGEWVDVGPTAEDLHIAAVEKIAVGQYLLGENFADAGGGDPSLSVAIPLEQYRSGYTFLAPESYAQSFVNVVAAAGVAVRLDGRALEAGEFSPVGQSGLSAARIPLTGGVHRMDGDAKFGIVVYGYGSYTSYMVPGGLDLQTVVVPR
jgi:hypothetical protein